MTFRLTIEGEHVQWTADRVAEYGSGIEIPTREQTVHRTLLHVPRTEPVDFRIHPELRFRRVV